MPSAVTVGPASGSKRYARSDSSSELLLLEGGAQPVKRRETAPHPAVEHLLPPAPGESK